MSETNKRETAGAIFLEIMRPDPIDMVGGELPNYSDEPLDDGYDGWQAIGQDPGVLRYLDDDSQAMDETNWAVVESVLADHEEAIDWGDPGDFYRVPYGECPYRSYRGHCHGTVLVRLGTALADRIQELSGRLANYPLLDEEAYGQREAEAWDDWYPQEPRGTIFGQAAADFLEDRPALWEDETPEEAGERLYDAMTADPALWDDAAHWGMAYYEGWTGHYDEAGAVGAVIRALEAVETLLRVMSTQGQRLARFQPPLPFGPGTIPA